MNDIPPPLPPRSPTAARAGAEQPGDRVSPTGTLEDLIEGVPPHATSLDQIDAELGVPPDAVDALYPPDDLPAPTPVELPGRGTTHMRLMAGPPAAPTVLLLHGWTANSALNWYTSYTPLAQRFRVLALDHRGHGRGMRAPEAFTLQDCADDAAALVDLLAIDRVIVVGYSMGGPIAQLLCRRHRNLVAGMVLCATAASFVGNSPGERAMQGVVTGLTFAARRAPEAFNKRIADRVVVSRYDDSALGLWAREEARLNDPRSIVEAGQALSHFSSQDWIGKLGVPTAVLVTGRDHVVAPDRQEALVAAIPGARRFPVDGDHDVCATQPDAFVPTLVEACLDVASHIGGRDADRGPAATDEPNGQSGLDTTGSPSGTLTIDPPTDPPTDRSDGDDTPPRATAVTD